MLNSIIDTFVNLDDDNKNKVTKIISNVINPIKIYLIVVILLLLVITVSNYYVCKKFIEFNIKNN